MANDDDEIKFMSYFYCWEGINEPPQYCIIVMLFVFQSRASNIRFQFKIHNVISAAFIYTHKNVRFFHYCGTYDGYA